MQNDVVGPVGGVCLTFDDRFVANWLAARAILRDFGARVTFCVYGIEELTSEQVDGLFALQADGHEIAHHSRTHPKLKQYLREFTLEKWLDEEIDSEIEARRRLGFPSQSFAPPHHVLTPDVVTACRERFDVIRGARPLRGALEQIQTRAFQWLGDERVAHNAGSIDCQNENFVSWEFHLAILDYLHEHKSVGVFTGHNIRGMVRRPGFYLTQADLIRILREVTERDLAFHTLAELAKLPRVSEASR